MSEELIAIPHSGVKPDWLDDDANIWAPAWGASRAGFNKPHTANWNFGGGWFLPADHQFAPVLRAGLTPWNPKLQGDGYPPDYAGGKFMLRLGNKICQLDGEPAEALDWGECGGATIIGYEPAPQSPAITEAQSKTLHNALLASFDTFSPPVVSEDTQGVAQEDREAAARALGYKDWEDANDYRNTGGQIKALGNMVQAFKAHRLASLTTARAEIARLREARNLAYGLLWGMSIDRRRKSDDLAARARETLLATMTKSDQYEGIDAARAALGDQP